MLGLSGFCTELEVGAPNVETDIVLVAMGEDNDDKAADKGGNDFIDGEDEVAMLGALTVIFVSDVVITSAEA